MGKASIIIRSLYYYNMIGKSIFGLKTAYFIHFYDFFGGYALRVNYIFCHCDMAKQDNDLHANLSVNDSSASSAGA